MPMTISRDAGRSAHAGSGRGTAPDFAARQLPKLVLRGEDLSRGRFNGCTAWQAHLSDCTLTRADMSGADFTGAVIRLCTLDRVTAAGAVFEGARIEDCSVVAADLAGARMANAGLTDSDFSRADLSRADLSGVSGESVILTGADLRGALLTGADLPDADLRGADLRGADLTGARLRGADLRGAQLDGARFDRCDLSGAQRDAGEARKPAGAPDFATLVNRIEDLDLASAMDDATGLSERLMTAFAAAGKSDPAALSQEIIALCEGGVDGADLVRNLSVAPELQRLMAAADLDPVEMMQTLKRPDAAQTLVGPFMAPVLGVLGLDPRATPQEVMDALMDAPTEPPDADGTPEGRA